MFSKTVLENIICETKQSVAQIKRKWSDPSSKNYLSFFRVKKCQFSPVALNCASMRSLSRINGVENKPKKKLGKNWKIQKDKCFFAIFVAIKLNWSVWQFTQHQLFFKSSSAWKNSVLWWKLAISSPEKTGSPWNQTLMLS